MSHHKGFDYPKKVTLGDITVRDGFQHEEKFIPTDAKIWVAEQLILPATNGSRSRTSAPPSSCPSSRTRMR